MVCGGLLFHGSTLTGFIDQAPSRSLLFVGLAGRTGTAPAIGGTFCSQPSIEVLEFAEGEMVLAAATGPLASDNPNAEAVNEDGGGGSHGSTGFDDHMSFDRGWGCG